LANPKIRVKNNEKARVHVGSREPIITVTTTDFQTSENIQYIDVGVKLNVEPRIELNGTIITKLGLEVSNVSGRERTQSGTVAITISSTNADTTLTLKDGEQTVIGGLIRDDESVTKNKLPILGDIPIFGEIFNGTGTTKTKREILLSITPHIVKSVHVPQGDIASIWSGGEDDLKFGRNFGTFVDEYQADQQGMKPQVTLPAPQVISPENSLPSESMLTQLAAGGADERPSGQISPGGITESEVIADTIFEEPLAEKEFFEQSFSSMLLVEGAERATQGKEFTLGFKIEQVKDLFSSALHIQYDPAVVQFVSAAEGSFLNQGGASTLFTYSVLEQSGQIVVGLKQGADGRGASGGGELFSLRFRATASGSTEIKPTLTNLRNTQGEKIDVDSSGLMVEVAP
jgi:general secretion pathway protein D